MDNLTHFKEVQYAGHTYKIGDEVIVLDHYTPRTKYIDDIYEDYYDDNSNYKCKWIYVSELNNTCSSHYHIDEICEDERMTQFKIQSKKDSYDNYVIRGY